MIALIMSTCSQPSTAEEKGENVNSHGIQQILAADTIADLVDQVSPGVVNIVCTGTAAGRGQVRVQRGSEDSTRKLRRHFGLDGPSEEVGSQVRTSGAGVLIRPNGYILTCLHVVQHSEEIRVILKDGRKFDAKIIGKDGFVDLAVIKIDAFGLPVVKFGDAGKLRVGQWVFAIGNPYAYENSVSAGLVSGLHREARSFAPAFGARTGAVTFIQTDVPLNVGSSGGPLVNLQGEVVGINSFIRVEAQNIGFATPANLVKKVAEDLIQKGSATHPYLGIEMRDASEFPQGAGLVSGVEVTKVKVPSPASNAGMQVGDLIMEMDSIPVHDPTEVSQVVAAHSIGEQISVRIKRSGTDKNLSVKVESLPEEFD